MDRGTLYEIAEIVIDSFKSQYPEIEIALLFYPVAHQPHTFFRQLSFCIKETDIQKIYRLDNLHTSAETSETSVRREIESMIHIYLNHFMKTFSEK